MNTPLGRRKDLVIKENSISTRGNCALCGVSDKPTIGPAIFVEGTWNFVCDWCAQREAPWLYAAAQLWQTHEAPKEFGGMSEDEAIREELLRKASAKPVRGFRQLDYFNPGTGALEDNPMNFEMFGPVNLELRNLDCLRLQIPEGLTPEYVIEGLERMIEWLRQERWLVENISNEVAAVRDSTLLRIKEHDENPYLHTSRTLRESEDDFDTNPFAEDAPPWLMGGMQNDSDDSFDAGFWDEVLQ